MALNVSPVAGLCTIPARYPNVSGSAVPKKSTVDSAAVKSMNLLAKPKTKHVKSLVMAMGGSAAQVKGLEATTHRTSLIGRENLMVRVGPPPLDPINKPLPDLEISGRTLRGEDDSENISSKNGEGDSILTDGVISHFDVMDVLSESRHCCAVLRPSFEGVADTARNKGPIRRKLRWQTEQRGTGRNGWGCDDHCQDRLKCSVHSLP
ncbi:hypothetical protein CIRG_06376 [Coccidioides immitis RMSCC 2394]|uniref:Uncharacterized protein n=1 Tax=Coccidioides immitis RMSCC 2394 TaxID=404692 RepID=A0A0J6YGF1_COCIT|nr:hypothetical protein CIRG_06376 [Coccidioides immitis RMSCC 2394]